MTKATPKPSPATLNIPTARSMMACLPAYALAPADAVDKLFKTRHLKPTGRIAIVEIVGILFKDVMVDLRRRIIRLAADDGVGEIVLLIDSPGGFVAGCADLALAIREARKIKPVRAFIEDLGASGAYWIASGATDIACNETCEVGSIGVFHVIDDFSEMFDRDGVKTHVISSGSLKGMGTPGSEVTGEQLNAVQRVVNTLAEQFMKSVQAGRGKRLSVERMIESLDGRLYVGEQAVEAGLVDTIDTFEHFLDAIEQRNLPERFADLRGQEASDQFDALICKRSKVDHADEASKFIVERVRSENPALSAAADEENERQQSMYRWRSQQH